MDTDIVEYQEINKIYYKLSVPLRVQESLTDYYDRVQTFDSVVDESFFETFLVNINGWNSTIEILNIPKISRQEAIHNVHLYYKQHNDHRTNHNHHHKQHNNPTFKKTTQKTTSL